MSLKMILSGLEVSFMCMLKLPSSIMLFYLGISAIILLLHLGTLLSSFHQLMVDGIIPSDVMVCYLLRFSILHTQCLVCFPALAVVCSVTSYV